MDTKNIGAGALFTRRIEALLERSTLPPETIITIIRSAHTNPVYDPIREIERLERKQRQSE